MGKLLESGLVLFAILGLWACSGERVNEWNSMDQWKNMESGEILGGSLFPCADEIGGPGKIKKSRL